ncbi:MAG: Gfo/Idh/MocA family oxidoreductase [Planctomycetota bacterium]|nr:Gfo/Idh/MocA family oxidoreductase [Planctomycetota bacterium]
MAVIEAFIRDWNVTEACLQAHPFRWTYDGLPLVREGDLGGSSWGLSVRRHTGRWERAPLAGTMDEMLQAEDLDIVVVTCENAKHPEVVAACAAAGAAVCVEKPMAMSLSDALAMVRAVRDAGTTMLVNWPMTWNPAAHKAKELIDAGAVGQVLEVKARLGHTGPLGAGAKHEGVSDEAAPLTPAGEGSGERNRTAGKAFLTLTPSLSHRGRGGCDTERDGRGYEIRRRLRRRRTPTPPTASRASVAGSGTSTSWPSPWIVKLLVNVSPLAKVPERLP